MVLNPCNRQKCIIEIVFRRGHISPCSSLHSETKPDGTRGTNLMNLRLNKRAGIGRSVHFDKLESKFEKQLVSFSCFSD